MYNWINIPFLYLEWLKSLYFFFFLITDKCYLTSIWLQGYKLDNFTIYRTSVQMRKTHILSIIMPYDNWWVVIIISFIPSFHRNNFCQLFNWFQLFSWKLKHTMNRSKMYFFFNLFERECRCLQLFFIDFKFYFLIRILPDVYMGYLVVSCLYMYCYFVAIIKLEYMLIWWVHSLY